MAHSCPGHFISHRAVSRTVLNSKGQNRTSKSLWLSFKGSAFPPKMSVMAAERRSKPHVTRAVIVAGELFQSRRNVISLRWNKAVGQDTLVRDRQQWPLRPGRRTSRNGCRSRRNVDLRRPEDRPCFEPITRVRDDAVVQRPDAAQGIRAIPVLPVTRGQDQGKTSDLVRIAMVPEVAAATQRLLL